MAKITRYEGNLKAFGADAPGVERTIFGSSAGSPVQSDDLTTNIDANFLRGWGTLPLGDKPPREWFNGFAFAATQLAAYLHQMGVAEADNLQEYYLNSFLNESGQLFTSLEDSNTGNPRDDTSKWLPVGGVQADTLVGLQLTRPTVEGSRAYVPSISASFRLKAEGDPALAGDVTAANGRVWGLLPYAATSRPEWRPEWFGAAGDLVTDDTTALQDAISRASGGGTVLLSSKYLYSATLNVNSDDTAVVGLGSGTGLIRNDGDFGDGLVFESSNPSTTTIFRSLIRDFEMDCSVEMNSGALLRVTEAAYATILNMSLQNGYIGFHGQGLRACEINLMHIRSGALFSGVKVGSRFMLLEDSPRPDQVGENVELFIANFNFTTNGAVAVEYGLEVREADGIWFDGGHIRGAFEANCYLNAAATPQLLGLQFDNVWFDGATRKCLYIAGSTGNFAGFINLSDCSFTGGSINAVHIEAGADLDWIEFSNPRTWQIDAQTPWRLDAGNNIIMSSPTFKALNVSDAATASAVVVGDAVENFVVNGGSLFDSVNIDNGFSINAGVQQATINGFAFRDLLDTALPIRVENLQSTNFVSAGCTTDQSHRYVKGNNQRGEFVNIADDTAVSVDIGEVVGGFLTVGLKLNAGTTGTIAFETEGAASISKVSGSATLEVTTGVLTGTTGNDGVLTVSVTDDGLLYIENRLGITRSVVWAILNRAV